MGTLYAPPYQLAAPERGAGWHLITVTARAFDARAVDGFGARDLHGDVEDGGAARAPGDRGAVISKSLSAVGLEFRVVQSSVRALGQVGGHAQSSHISPSTRANSRVFAVTSVMPRRIAWPAIIVS